MTTSKLEASDIYAERSGGRLNSRKEIVTYLWRNERTVSPMEKEAFHRKATRSAHLFSLTSILPILFII